MKRFLALIMAAAIVLTVTGCGGKKSESSVEMDTSYLNLDSELPIVKKGENKTLKVAINMYSDSGDADTQWFYDFVEKEMNIKLDVTKLSSAGSEQIMLMFASGDLPDVIIGSNLSPTSLMKYGSSEEMLLNLEPYITEKLTPNIYNLFKENPSYKEAVCDTEGKIWSLGYINNTKDRGQISRAFLNYDWMDEASAKTPETLDEFIALMKKFKSRGGDIVPMGGSFENSNPMLIILNSMGYLTEDPQGTTIAKRNGKYVLPVADRECYGNYIKTFKQLYDDGIIDKNFFTLSASQVRSNIAGGKCGYIATAPFSYITDYTSWWGAQPLTSQYNKKAQWPQSSAALTCGGLVVSADSQCKELAMRFADWFFGNDGKNYNLSTNGPANSQTDYIYNKTVTGYDIDKNTFEISFPDYDKNVTKYSSKNDYLGKEVYLWGYRILGLGICKKTTNIDAYQYGYKPEEIKNTYPDVSAKGIQGEFRKKTTNGEMHFRSAMEDTMVPYVSSDYIPNVYLEPDTANDIANLLTIVREYATEETAKFVTGRRPLSELDDYFNTIEKLGSKDVVKAYSDYFKK